MTALDIHRPKNHLHFTPISAHVYAGVSFAGASLSHMRWNGKAVQILAKAVFVTGYALNSLLATAEMIAAISVSAIIGIPTLACKDSPCLRKACVKTVSYAMHCTAIVTIQALQIYKWTFFDYHSINSFIQHIFALLSEATIQELIGTTKQDIVYLWVDNGEQSLKAVIDAVYRDFGHLPQQLQGLRQQLQNPLFFHNFLAAHPIHRTTLQRLHLSGLQQNDSQARVQEMIYDFIRFVNISDILLDNSQINEYQKQLMHFVKVAYKEIHESDSLASYLTESAVANDGKEALEAFYANIYIPLAHYAQLKELERLNSACPRQFTSSKQHQYNNRYGQIQAARKLLSQLPANEKPLLVRKLLQGSSFKLDAECFATQERINTLRNLIGELAGSLHQGNLMSQTTINTTTLHVSANNLFHKACMEALVEL